MVALTDGVIEYSVGAEPIRRRVGALLFNRELASWIVEGTDETDPLDAFVVPPEEGPLVKDFTGDVLGWGPDGSGERSEDVPSPRDVARAA